jgi:hypothetical protein
MVLIPPSHTPGRHCASTGVSDLVRHHGIPWGEALCFGLGQGLGIYYFPAEGMGVSRIVHVRHADFELRFFKNMGAPFAWEQHTDPGESEKALRAALDDGRPAVLQTDIFHLPHFSSKTHFPGHLVTAWGYDPERRVFFITDTHHPDLIEVPFDNMRRARFARGGIFDVCGNMFAPKGLVPPADLAGALRRAIVNTARELLDSPAPHSGMGALACWREELPLWPGFPDWIWAARFAYQIIERRGTGGGGFRLMYADFLEEAAKVLPEVEEAGLPGLAREAGTAWTELAMALKAVSEQPEMDVSLVATALDAVIFAEGECHKRALGIA